MTKFRATRKKADVVIISFSGFSFFFCARVCDMRVHLRCFNKPIMIIKTRICIVFLQQTKISLAGRVIKGIMVFDVAEVLFCFEISFRSIVLIQRLIFLSSKMMIISSSNRQYLWLGKMTSARMVTLGGMAQRWYKKPPYIKTGWSVSYPYTQRQLVITECIVKVIACIDDDKNDLCDVFVCVNVNVNHFTSLHVSRVFGMQIIYLRRKAINIPRYKIGISERGLKGRFW